MAALTTWLVQGASLPNLALWALSFLAGPGVSVVDGASLTWSGSSSGLLPLVPVFAALPQPGAFPWFMVLVVIVPILCGGFIGRCALAGVARLSALRTKLLVAGSAAVGTAMLIGALDLVGGATLGAYRLSDVGAPAGWLTLALAGRNLRALKALHAQRVQAGDDDHVVAAQLHRRKIVFVDDRYRKARAAKVIGPSSAAATTRRAVNDYCRARCRLERRGNNSREKPESQTSADHKRISGLPFAELASARIQSAMRLTPGTSASTDQNGENPSRFRINPTG